MNKNIAKLLAILMMCFALVSVLVACGEPGPQGEPGKSPYMGSDGKLYVWNEDINDFEPVDIKGDKGDPGNPGNPGNPGADAKSPYMENGLLYVWDEATNSYKGYDLKGDKGDNGVNATDCDKHQWFEYNGELVTIEHEYIKHVYDAATGQTANGLYLRVCDYCGDAEWFYDVIHHWVETGRDAANCTEDGKIHYECACGATKTEKDADAPALGHDYKDTVTLPETCTKDGIRTYTCSRSCGLEGYTYTEPIKALGHAYVPEDRVPETCLADAYTISNCSRNCGEEGHTKTDVETGTKLEHKAAVGFDPANIDECWKLKEVVCICMEDQIYTSACVNGCAGTEHATTLTATIEAIGQHTFTGKLIPGENNEHIPACKWEQPMLDYCTVCQKANFPDCEYYHIISYNPPALHDWSEATCTEPATCKTCGDTKGEALGHDYANATCTTPETCTRCQVTNGEAKGHEYNSQSRFDIVEVPTLNSTGKLVVYCDVCKEIVYTVILPELSEANGYVKGIIKPTDEKGDTLGCLFYVDTYIYTVVLENNRGSIEVPAFEVYKQHFHSDIPAALDRVIDEETGELKYYCYVCEHCQKTVLVPVGSVTVSNEEND